MKNGEGVVIKYKAGDKVVLRSGKEITITGYGEDITEDVGYRYNHGGWLIFDEMIDHEATERLNKSVLSKKAKRDGKVYFSSNPSTVKNWLYRKWIDGHWAEETLFNKAREQFIANHDDVYGCWRKGSRTTVKLKCGATGRVDRYHRDKNCDTIALYEAYIKALKDTDQVKARIIIREAAEKLDKAGVNPR